MKKKKTEKYVITCERCEAIKPTIKKVTLKLRDLTNQYKNDSDDEGGSVSSLVKLPQDKNLPDWLAKKTLRLLIRPEFQRSYVVGDDEHENWRAELIETVVQGLVLNPIFIGATSEGDVLVVIDGQQRLITLADFIAGVTSYKFKVGGEEKERLFGSLPSWVRENILEFPIDVNVCIGSKEVLYKYFRTINQPTYVLNFMELLSSSYTSEFMEDAKRAFVPSSARAKRGMFNDKNSKYYLSKYASTSTFEKEDKGDVRMQLLRQALYWVGYRDDYKELGDQVKHLTDKDIINKYVENHKDDENAADVKAYVRKVVDFICDLFIKHQNPSARVMKDMFPKFDVKVGWVNFYERYKDDVANLSEEDKENISKRLWNLYKLTKHESVHDKCYFFEYVMIEYLKSPEEAHKYLKKVRALNDFDYQAKVDMYNALGGIDILDGKHYSIEEMDAHHIISRLNGGDNNPTNMGLYAKQNHQALHSGRGLFNGIQFTAEMEKRKRDEQIEKISRENQVEINEYEQILATRNA